ncbi:MAG: phage tail protein [Caldilineaceae bacterium]
MAGSDPLLRYQFTVEVSGNLLTPAPVYFSELSGLNVEYNVLEYKTFSQKGIPLIVNVPGRPTYAPITLKRGITSGLSFWTWHQMVYGGEWEKAKADVNIILRNRAYEPVWRWALKNAWPSRISGPQFSTDSTDVILEELTLVYEGISLIQKGQSSGGQG